MILYQEFFYSFKKIFLSHLVLKKIIVFEEKLLYFKKNNLFSGYMID